MTLAQDLSARLCELFSAAEPRVGFPPELAFMIAEGITPELVEPVVPMAAEDGVTGEAAMFGRGVSDDLYYRLLARHLGAVYLEAPLALESGVDVAAAASTGIARLAPNRLGLRRVHAPRGEALRALLRDHLFGAHPSTAIAITTPRRLDALLRRHDAAGVLGRAQNGLADWDPSLSARGGSARWHVRLLLSLAAPFGVALDACPGAVWTAAAVAAFLLYVAAVVQILLVVEASRQPPPSPGGGIADRDLPVYTVLVPLYREARVLPQLIGALDALDYPRAKLDIKLLLEAADRDTIAAVARRRLPARYDVLVLDDGHPRTKPRALNAGLEWARGDYVVVYDAEDRPDPGQLRAAVGRFAEAPARLACLQARLVVDHAGETWMTRFFALEYAALFGAVKPGLAAYNLPVPLGGTSNHFRIAALRQVGGWDAWNVTEDIDLGFRLARFGFAVETLHSDTAEEAPLDVARWLPQRARWLKGWMVTLVVCLRDPVRLVRDLGFWCTLSVLVTLGATVGSALVGPGLAGWALFQLLTGAPLRFASLVGATGSTLWTSLFAAGAVAIVWPTLVGLKRIGRLDLAPWIGLLPFYYLLIIVAAWRAACELCRDPQRWNKTEHGLARMRPRGRSRR